MIPGNRFPLPQIKIYILPANLPAHTSYKSSLPVEAGRAAVPVAPPMTAPTHPRLATFTLGPFTAPRLWVGLWQLSSTAWGSAPASRIREAMARHVDQGYTAFGKRELSWHNALPPLSLR